MNLEFTAEEQAFRDEVRAFIAESHPKELGDFGMREDMTREEMVAWHKILGTKGWSVPAWPVEYGGTGWTPTQRYIWSEENARANTFMPLPFGVSMVGPVIYTFGNAEQKAQHLPGIRSGEVWWCQGYSEPGAGSDLASLKTTAVRDGDHYVINGQKTWTTLAQHADWGFFLCRTDPTAKAQEGISFILVDMKTPGVEVKPIKLLDGGYEVNETWLTDVRVPVENLVGVENKGWTYAKFLLAHERSGIAGVARSKRGVEKLREIAANETLDGAPLIKDFDFAKKVSQLEIDLAALEITELRTLAGEQAGKGPGPESSILKIKGTEIQQRLTELTLEAVGTYSAPYYGSIANDTGSNEYAVGPAHAQHAAATYFNMRKTSIYGGSNEIQRNIITKMILGL
ncbi:alkylation response protein AidB-like acyl-CoA dehydrogenase [Erythromicrobium ramosum]|uniref:Alkylation response protein AidB-like acyl-CoA dehydrogenase n=1 Tax=Erythrobacter ramosus TaxID=35811 RepID=A0A6I4ULP1_9SPHN|nr:acyl-CoA dehydrogenase family protein [Erythrobacter ramosus]MBB3776693.1 alkylation response protein AidB-like acyl-CoA dehydrogenase [Erythrobacter ramosus]MXP39548.1 pimeloyl-CoA dehydrogenase large subunit [Erythrobacter ramosus]